MKRLLTSVVLSGVVASFLALGATVAAQACPQGDDRLFNGNCCDSVEPSLPAFPDFSSRAQWICVENCSPNQRARAEIGITNPTFIDCDRAVFEARFNVDFGSGIVVQWRGRLNGKYSRTFGQISSTGRSFQVWRFLINGDFEVDTNGNPGDPCQVVPSFFLFDAVHFVGHIDYACDGQGGYDVALSLQHYPGCIAHGSFSDRPDNGPLSHPDRNYYLVAPINFTPGANQGTEPQGTIAGEEMRLTSSPFGRCISEIPMRQTSINTIFRGCPCVGGNPQMPWVAQRTLLAASCNGQTTRWRPIAVGPFTPPGLNAQVVGRWNMPADTYPERQTLIHYQALVEPLDEVICNPELTEKHWLYGVGMKGNRNFSMHPVPSFQFYDNNVDLVNAVNEDQKFSWGVPSTSTIQFGLFIR